MKTRENFVSVDPWILYTSIYIFLFKQLAIQRFANGNEMRDGRVLNIYEQFTRVSHLAYRGRFLAWQILFIRA